MRGFASVPSEPSPPSSARDRGSWFSGQPTARLLRGPAAAPALVLAVLYLLLHLPFLAPSLEDIDSINFGLALHDYDIAQHQPHPPGYPVYIALGRAARTVIAAVAPGLPPLRTDALALSIWSAIGGAIALVAAWALFAGLQGRADPWSVWAAALLAFTPLFWMSGLRPMSDMPGLAIALTAQALLLRGFDSRAALIGGAVASGLALGIRSQTLWLTLPLLAAALLVQRRAGVMWLLTRPVAALIAASLAWAVPLLVLSGGIDGYLAALGVQAGEDFAGVDMLLFNPTPRRLATGLIESFALPWGSIAVGLPALALAGFGAGAMLMRERKALGLLALAYAPYAIFHLLLQETFHIRYALPLVPAMVWLIARGAAAVVSGQQRLRGSWLIPATVAALPLVLLAGWRAVPAGVIYGREAHPAFRAIGDMAAAITAGDRPAAIFSHYALRRPLQAVAPLGTRIVEPRRSYEWLDMVDYWVEGGRAPVWFLADAKRTDLALIDPRSQRQGARSRLRQYRWSVGDNAELGGARPIGVDWYRFDGPPAWFAAEGWALTPETGGLADATTMGVDHEPIDAYVRRRQVPLHIVVGVRHLGAPTDAATEFALSIDDVVIERWTLDPAAALSDLRFIDLPNGVGPGRGDFAHLSIAARSRVPGQPTPKVAVRQFDVQPAATVIYGFGDGWHEAEYDNASGLSWRWTSERSVIHVAPARSIRLTVRGESPLRYVDSAPQVRVTAGGRTIAELRPDRDFTWTVNVPADAVIASGGAIAIETDKIYLPGAAEGTADARHLGLRLFEVGVDAGIP